MYLRESVQVLGETKRMSMKNTTYADSDKETK